MAIVARPVVGESGMFYLTADRDRETYGRREAIKAVGGRWDGHHWRVTDDQRRLLGIDRMVKVIGAGCHAPLTAMVPESKAVKGAIVPCFCDECDGRTTMLITAVAREEPS